MLCTNQPECLFVGRLILAEALFHQEQGELQPIIKAMGHLVFLMDTFIRVNYRKKRERGTINTARKINVLKTLGLPGCIVEGRPGKWKCSHRL